MIRRPIIQRSQRGMQSSVTASSPAPIGGWNARDPVARMKPTEALWLENWWPDTADVSLRKGARYHVTGIPGKVESLMAYRSAGKTELFAAAAGKIYDVSFAGEAPVEKKVVTNNRFQHVHFAPVGSTFIVAVNGVDPLQLYDGTDWKDITAATTPAITGLPTTALTNVCLHKRRLWFVQQGSMSAWYLPVDQVGGALTEFPVGQLFSKGGYLVAQASWSIDGGDGPDDYLVFVTSAGEVAIYKGTDPSIASDWGLVGVYFIGEPLGPKCCTKMGGDVLIATQEGLYPLSKAFQSATLTRSVAISNKIDQKFSEATSAYASNYGWSGIVFPRENILLVNVPLAEGELAQQFVMNTLTNAWALFSGWNAFCWETAGSGIFFGGDGYVAQALSGTDDFGEPLVARVKTAFNYFGSARQKHFKLFRPIIHSSEDVSIDFSIDVDFDDVSATNPVKPIVYPPPHWDEALWDDPASLWGEDQLPSPPGNPLPFQFYWDSAVWDNALWSSDQSLRTSWWTAFGKTGFCVAVRLRITAKGVILGWSSTDFLFQKGGVL